MNVLLDTEPFQTPQGNNNVLPMFLAIKQRLVEALASIKEEIEEANASIIVCLKPTDICVYYLTTDKSLGDTIGELISQNFDLEDVAAKLKEAGAN